jgi:hypothetical protein
MNDVQAAADRIRKHHAACDRNDFNAVYKEANDISNDEGLIIDYFLSLDPASLPRPDDGEGISAQWLERCGFQRGQSGYDWMYYQSFGKIGMRIESIKRGKIVVLDDGNGHGGSVGEYPTRGDLRRLLVGLGITLKETE